MNKNRRKSILDINVQLNSILAKVESVISDELDYQDNTPENLQGSYRYEKSEECSDHIDDAISDLNDAIEAITNAVKSLDLAIS